MSNPLPLAVEALSSAPSAPTFPSAPVAEKKADRPHLTLIAGQDSLANAGPASASPDLPALMSLYRGQKRECWLCSKIAGSVDSGKEISEDDRYHFTSCILSWESLKG